MPAMPDPLQSPAPPPSTWGALLRDPYTTVCGLAAGAVVLSTMDWHQPGTWVAFVVAVVWGSVQADSRRHLVAPQATKEVNSDDAPRT